MQFARFFGMLLGLDFMAPSNLGVMPGFFAISGFMMLCSGMVVLRCHLVVLAGFRMMFGGF